MSDDERGDGVSRLFLAWAMDTAMEPIWGRFDSEKRFPGKARP